MTPDLPDRLRASADEVESFPHPTFCDHMHVAHAVMREAAAAIEAYELGARSTAAQPVGPTMDERGWLIEHSGETPGTSARYVSWLRVRPKFGGYGAKEFGFTHDASDALRFARREDAEAVLAMHMGAKPPDWYRRPYSVTEHLWPHHPAASGDSTPPSATVQGDPSGALRPEPEAAGQGRWQPIETAPKDGTVIDLWIGGEFPRREAECYWGKPHHECGEMGRLCDSDWHDLEDGWVPGHGLFEFSLSDGEITHWMPEPEPPQAASGCSHTAGPDDQSKVDDQEPTAGSSHG